MINRYEGNTGRVTRLPEPQDLHPAPPPPVPAPRAAPNPPGIPDLRRLLPVSYPKRRRLFLRMLLREMQLSLRECCF